MSGTWLPNLTNRITFVLVDAAYTEVAGLGGTYTLEVSKNGGAFAGSAGVKTEISNGWYSYVATAAEANTIGPVSIRATDAAIIQQNLVYEVRDWSAIILSATGLAAIAAAVALAVWSYVSRTLTLSLAILRTILRRPDIEILRGDTFDLDISRLGDLTNRTKLWFSVKDDKDDTDAQSMIQIEETAGLLYIAAATAETPANGSITVTDAVAGNITIYLEAVETAKLPLAGNFFYDIQVLYDTGVVETLVMARSPIVGDISRAVS